jgi:hypothetical protein
MPTLLGVLLQMTAPTILSLPASMWIHEVLILRGIAIQSIELLLAHCSASNYDKTGIRDECLFYPDDSSVSNAARGIFLLAYQGVSLISSTLLYYSDGFKFLDPYLPSQYNQLFSAYESLHDATTLPVSSHKMLPCLTHRRIRVGFLSTFFRLHSVGRLISRVIVRLAESAPNIEIFILIPSHSHLSKHESIDEVTDSLSSLPSIYSQCNLIKLSMYSSHAAVQIRGLNLDVMIFGDLHMDTLTTSLARKRLAVTQAAFWGHPFTSGSASIDYFIASSQYFSLEAGNEEHSKKFGEQVVLFDTLNFLMYSPRSPNLQANSVNDENTDIDTRLKFMGWLFKIGRDAYGNHFQPPEGFHLEANAVRDVRLFGCHQSIMKMHPLFDLAIEKILSLDTRALIILSFSPRQILWQRVLAQRLRKKQGTRQWIRRVVFVDQMNHDSYLRLICGCDVTLDPFPFGGGVTLVDSLSCGLFPIQGQNSSTAHPVPFVTSPQLQSVLQLGVGIERSLVTMMQAMNHSSVRKSVQEHNISTDFQKHVFEYAKQALALAQQRRSNETLNEKQFSSQEIWHLYENEDVVEEWKSFLWRISNKHFTCTEDDFLST